MKHSIRLSLAYVIAATWSAVMPGAQGLGPREVNGLPSRPADARVNYATSDPLQFGELRLPKGRGPFPVAIVIHGGCWVSTLATLQNTTAFGDALRNAGVATWNVEYRRLDNPGGGWPATFADVAAAADCVRTLAKQHDWIFRASWQWDTPPAPISRWLAARSRLPSNSLLYRKTPLRLRGAVALGGPGDLRDFTTYARDICGAPVIELLLGGTAQAVPDRYAQASPVELLPFRTPHILIVGTEDGVMPPRARDAYVAAALKAGDRAESVAVPGAGHFETIAPTSAAWPIVRDKILELLGNHGG